ncbi:abrin-a-like [Pyrus x bretschneideri]|uniref:abrin-a-like n=1 Tax=Pyrus x bretschneideri TaxID=225117 RepID=UPI00202F3CE6|nr:abrin-a-like [Pyrus x bretschneideri]
MHKMRFLLAAACLVLASCLNVRVIEGRPGDIEFSTQDATDDSYQNFISALRGLLTRGTTTVHDISVLNSKPFILVDLSNRIGSTIILAIDKENTNVVAYVAGDKSYFLKDAPVAALNTLFPPTTSFYLPFTSSYTDLEKAGRKSRWEIPLGLTPLDNAITTLWEGGDSKAAQSLLVATQIVLEAAKSIIVEQRVRDSIQDKGDFLPDAGILANREF